MRIILTGGGTAGHINPALAVAGVLQKQGHEVFYAGVPGKIEQRLANEAGLPFKGFEAAGFDRAHIKTLPAAVYKISRSTKKAKAWFREIKPACVVAFGGYVCIPVARAAEQCGIPVVVHEQNSVMGMANKYLSRRAAKVCLTYEHAASVLSNKSNVVVTGNPVRQSVFDATREEARCEFNIPSNATLLLVTGGSLGARHLNAAIVERKEMLLSHPNLYIIHVTGKAELESVKASLNLSESEALRWQLFGFTNKMGQCMAAADAIVSRSGASSLAEISARKIPALLVPFPYATGDHQTMNAKACVEAGSAFLVPDAEVEGEQFTQYLTQLIEDGNLRKQMSEACAKQKTGDASNLVASCVIEACAG